MMIKWILLAYHNYVSIPSSVKAFHAETLECLKCPSYPKIIHLNTFNQQIFRTNFVIYDYYFYFFKTSVGVPEVGDKY